jgi:hypothetical protein
MFDESVCFIVNIKKLNTSYFIIINNVSLKSLNVMEECLKLLYLLCSNFFDIELVMEDIQYITTFIPYYVFEILSSYKVLLVQTENTVNFTINEHNYSQVLFDKKEIYFDLEKNLHLYVDDTNVNFK